MVLVAIVLFSLMAFAAIAVDVAQLVQERRTLQNGADAASLAVADDCAQGECGDYRATAADYASRNADDGVSGLVAGPQGVCGTSPLPTCPDPEPASLPAGAGYVRVTTETRATGGGDEVSYTFGRVLGLSGATVRRRATAIWGGRSSGRSKLPLTISACEFKHYTNDGLNLTVPTPDAPYSPADVASERVLYFHDTTGANPCEQSSSGADLPGGFGWLQTATDCETPSSIDGWFNDSTGVPPPSSCDPAEMKALVGQVIDVPIYDEVNGLTGSNGRYHIGHYAAFYLTGYSINGQFKEKSLVTGNFPCSGSSRCISGHFVKGEPSSGNVGGPNMGSLAVQIIE